MSEEFKVETSGRTRHTHPEDETDMPPDVLRGHLARHHGWTQAMFDKGRANGPEGLTYMRIWHENDHKPMATQ